MNRYNLNNDKLEAIVTVGVSCSGKSTFANTVVPNEFGKWVEVNRDNIRKTLTEHDGKEFLWKNWDWKREKEVNNLVYHQIRVAHQNSKNIIISDTNLNNDRRNQLVKKLEDYGYSVEIREFEVSFDEAIRRDAERRNGVGVGVIARQFEQWNEYKNYKKYIPDLSLPKCIIVDIDGTLAHESKDREIFEWDKVSLDIIDNSVKKIVNLYARDNVVIVLSGRSDICFDGTLNWLVKNGVLLNFLFMRKSGDMRDDVIVKSELFWNNIATRFNVEFAIDDRPKVCDYWRSIGLKVFQVGNPNIRF